MEEVKINFKRIEAAVFDLDGVITKTARVHAKAWKKLFDEYLRQRNERYNEDNRPFEIESDYTEYVDGVPRYDGVSNFLRSRGIKLDYGSSDDEAGTESICGLGNLKNSYFLEKLREDGVEVYEGCIKFIKSIRAHGIKTAIVTSSKNCSEVLKAAGIDGLFDAQVDGNDINGQTLKGKPEPDIFIEACRRVDVDTQNAIAFEDATSGVRAASKANFREVVGVDRVGHGRELKDNGADIIVTDISSLLNDTLNAQGPQEPNSAIDEFEEITGKMANKRCAIFLDYDGTLTPIVERPEDALISDAMKNVVTALSKKCTVGIISGRDLGDVRSKAGVENIVYAGSHGYDVFRPGAENFTLQKGEEFLPALDEAEKKLKELAGAIENCQIERKKFSIAIHYRRVAEKDTDKVENAVDEVHSTFSQLRKKGGKKIFELQPDIEWDKGKALLWLMDKLGINDPDTLPFYIGDDVTDEDAFKALKGRGISIIVAEETHGQSNADYRLKDTETVKIFLEKMLQAIKG